MTLNQWCEDTHTQPTNAPNGRDAVSINAGPSAPKFSVLFNLEDYRVARREGLVVVMMPTK